MGNNFAGHQNWGSFSVAAGAAITARSFVKWSSGAVIMTAAQGEDADGYVLEAVASGAIADVIVTGIVPVRVKTAASFAQGDWLTPSATTDDGMCEEAASGDYKVGKILEAPSADDDHVMAVINCINGDIAA